MPRRIGDFRGLTQSSRVTLLYAIQRLPGRKLEELASEAGIHINTAREHLQVLEDEGFIISRPISTGTRGRPPVVFDPVQKANESPQADQRVADAQAKGDLIRRLYPTLDQSDEIGEDGQHQIDVVFSHLEDVGLEPQTGETGMEITMQPCTYHGLIDERGSVVCAVHARLIEDQLSQVSGPVKVGELKPFVTPHQCSLMLIAGRKTESDEHEDL